MNQAEINRESLPYRPCVGLVLVNRDRRVFVGKRIDHREGDYWQMPQGGVDPGEDLRTAALRELWEETGLTENLVTLEAQTGRELYYDLPDELLGRMWSGKYRGQCQHWFLTRFHGTDADVKLDAHDPAEFCDFKWVEPETLPGLIVPFKREVYAALLEEFRERF